NRAAYLREAVDSVFAQTFTDWELIVIDDGSTDATAAYLKSLDDPRVRVIELEHSGIPAKVRNAGLGAATGEFIAFLDSDDRWYPRKLELQVAKCRNDSDSGWCSVHVDFVDDRGAPL